MLLEEILSENPIIKSQNVEKKGAKDESDLGGTQAVW